jgi:hypothetical protein
MKIMLPVEVAQLYQIVKQLEHQYVGRPFTLDGHLVGSLGEVIAERVFGLSLYPPSYPTHDGRTSDGKEVQIKLTGGKAVGLRDEPDYLLVMKIVDPTHADVVYNGPGKEPWEAAGKMQKNGQRRLSVSKLERLNMVVQDNEKI